VGNYAGTFVTLLIGFFLTPFIIHRLGDAQFGIWSLTGSIVAYLGLLDLGLAPAVAKYLAEYKAQGRDDLVNQVVSTILVLYCGLGVIAFLILFLINLFFISLFHISPELAPATRFLLILVGFDMMLTLPLSILNASLVGYQRIDLNNVALVLALGLKAILTVALLQRGVGLIGLAIASLGFTLCLAIGRGMILRRKCPDLAISLSSFRKGLIRHLVDFSALAFGLNVIGLVIYHTDSILIGLLLSASAITPFAIAFKLSYFIRNLIEPLSGVLFPAFSEAVGMADSGRVHNLLIEGTKVCTAIATFLSVVLLTLGQPLVQLWAGEGYVLEATPLLYVLVVAFWSNAVTRPGGSMLFGTGRLEKYFFIAGGNAIANLALSALLAGPYGLLGVALGTTIPMVVGSLILLGYVCRVVNIQWFQLARGSFLAPMAIGLPVAAIIAISGFLGSPSWLTLLLRMGIGFGVYLGLYVVFCMSSAERQRYRDELDWLGHVKSRGQDIAGRE
jgi:O-antigen/teichoic acid export membrane protein